MHDENIGKIDVKMERNRSYISKKERNGKGDQSFTSNCFPESLTFRFCKTEEHEGTCYEGFVLCDKFNCSLSLKGIQGYNHGEEELNKISQIYRGEATDGREVAYSRNIRVEDIDSLARIKVDYNNQKIFQMDDPKNIITQNVIFKLEDSHDEKKFYYEYDIKKLKIDEETKSIISYGKDFWLSSPFVFYYGGFLHYGLRSMYGGNSMYFDYLYVSDNSSYTIKNNIRPIIFLKAKEN